MHTAIQHLAECVDNHSANSGTALGKRVGAQEHHGADDFVAKWRAHAHRVRPHEVYLEFANVVGRDAHVAQLADTGGDSVGQAIVCHQVFDDGASAIHSHAGFRLEHYGTPVIHDGGDVFQGEIVAVDMEYF